jgi:ADP-ribosylglycohydrolase
MDSLLTTLAKGGDTDANCAVVMGLVGSIVGYTGIPSYFKQKIVNSRMSQSSRPRNDEYSPYHIIEIVERLMKIRPATYMK